MIDQVLLSELQYALIEPPDGGASWPSGAWTRDEVLDLVNAAERTLLKETFLVVTRAEQAVLAADLGVVTLPADWMATLHLVWRTAGGTRSPLGPADRFEADLMLPTWQATAAVPIAYADMEGDTLTLQLIPRPAADGTLEVLYVARPTPVNGEGRSFALPDEFLHGVKYGGLGGLLRKVGRLQDPERAAYCDEQYLLTRILAGIVLEGGA